jgi:hypothetical protein
MTPRRPNQRDAWVEHYGRCRLEIGRNVGAGWVVRACDDAGRVSFTLRNRVPAGLPVLLEEARERIDRVECSFAPGW